MTQIRNKMFGLFIAAVLLAGFALPSMAAPNAKDFLRHNSPSSLAADPMSTMTLNNTSTCHGVSTINSIRSKLGQW